MVVAQVHPSELGEALDAIRHLGQLITAKVEIDKVGEQAEELGVDGRQLHIAQRQPAHMHKIDTCRQGWQRPHLLTVDGQFVLIVAIDQLAPPTATQCVSNTAAADGIDR
ncbi:hypothetical protein D9M71_594290 [compost metagenome]